MNVDKFLEQISREPLLTADQEIVLGRNVLAWLATGGDKHDPSEVAKEGIWARNELIQRNLRLVVSIAKKNVYGDDELMDVVQNGCIGLRRAAEKFDPDKGFRFSTYATTWIYQSATRESMLTNRTIRLPVSLSANLTKMRRAWRDLSMELGRSPKDEEVAERLEITVDRLHEWRDWQRKPTSMDAQSGEDGTLTLHDALPDKSEPPVEDEYDWLRSRVAALPEEQRRVVCLYYGLTPEGLALKDREIAKRVKLSVDRVKRLRRSAVAQIKEEVVA
ncbi:MAG: sigma-70 family RNA polymerase sigma factor [Cyanobacteria bacterium P01_F01_bin.153]